MLKQIKYAARIRLNLRLVSLLGVLALNAVFGVCGATGAYGNGGMITAITLVSLAFTALLVINVLCDAEMVRSLFAAPSGYATFLTPVPSWKILLARLLPMFVFDILGLVIGICGIVLQSYLFAPFPPANRMDESDVRMIVFGILILLIIYLIILLMIFLVGALSKSILYRVPGRGILAVLLTCAAVYALHWLTMAVAPMGTVRRVGVTYMVNISIANTPAMVVYTLILACIAAVLFAATAYLMERKINI